MKTCNACGETKSTDAFYVGKRVCKPCYIAKVKARPGHNKPAARKRKESSTEGDLRKLAINSMRASI